MAFKKCFFVLHSVYNGFLFVQKPSNVWDSGILSDICSPIGSSIPSLDKEPMFSSLPCPSNGTDCHSVTDHGVNLKDLQFGMVSKTIPSTGRLFKRILPNFYITLPLEFSFTWWFPL